MRIMSSLPEFSKEWCIGMHAATDRSSGEASTSQQTEETSITLKGSQSMFIWGSRSSLQPQGILEWPLWIHPRSPGLLTFHCVWYYEPVAPVEGMRFRSAGLMSFDAAVVEFTHWNDASALNQAISNSDLRRLGLLTFHCVWYHEPVAGMRFRLVF